MGTEKALALTQSPRGLSTEVGILKPCEFDPCYLKGRPFWQVSSSGAGIPEHIKMH